MCFIKYNVIDGARCDLMNKFCGDTTNLVVSLREIKSGKSALIKMRSFCNMYAVFENYIPLYYCYPADDPCYYTSKSASFAYQRLKSNALRLNAATFQ